MTVRAKLRSSPVTWLEFALWLFELGWLRVVLNPSPLSIVGRVLEPQGAGALAVPGVVLLCVLGAVGIFGCFRWVRRVHMIAAAFWWTMVWFLIYRTVTPVSGHLPYLPNDSGAYSYALIAIISIIEAVHVGWSRDRCRVKT